MAKRDHIEAAVNMLRQHRWAALATVDESGYPAASMVAYCCDEKGGYLYLHLSSLATHSKALLKTSLAALVITENDDLSGDPQQLARLSLRGPCQVLEKGSEEYVVAKACYLRCLPDAEQLFGFGDFQLFRVTPESLRYVAGFGQAHSYRAEEMWSGNKA